MKWTDADLVEVLTELCSDIAETYDPGLKRISRREKREVIHRTLKDFGYLPLLKELASGIAQAGPTLPRCYSPDTGWHKRAARAMALRCRGIDRLVKRGSNPTPTSCPVCSAGAKRRFLRRWSQSSELDLLSPSRFVITGTRS